MLRLGGREGRCLRSEAEGRGAAGQLQSAAVCVCARVRVRTVLGSSPGSAPTPHPSMTSHFLGCLCRGVGKGGDAEREKKLAPLFGAPILGREEEMRWGWATMGSGGVGRTGNSGSC